MSEERLNEARLDQALEAMKNETTSATDAAEARARVWQKLSGEQIDNCTAFRAELRQYVDGGLSESRRTLLEDHLGRCPSCRKLFAEMKGERKVTVMPAARKPVMARWQGWAIAAGLGLAIIYAGRDRIDNLMAPSGPRATVEVASGGLYRLPEGALLQGASLNDGDVVRTGPGARAILRLADGSAVEVNERSELYVTAAWSGQTVHLNRGDVIVQAAKQRRGHLKVATRDSVASVKGTIFAVSAGMSGSLVAVVEGSVQVTQPGTDQLLTRGQQAATQAELGKTPVRQTIAWSQNIEQYLALLGDLNTIEKKLAAIPTPALRTQANLLAFLPTTTVMYGAVPNLAGTIRQAVALADQQAAQSGAFQQWWTSPAGVQMKEMLGKLQIVLPMVGDEIVFAMAANGAEKVPVLIAEVQPGQETGLKVMMATLTGAQYQLTEKLLIVSDSAAHLQWVTGQMGSGASTPFAAEILKRYQRGAGWLVAMDVAALPRPAAADHPKEMMGIEQMKYVFFEQRTAGGVEENEATLAFAGARTGIAAWLAAKGTGGAAEYISSDALLAFSASTKDSKQLYDEIVARLTKEKPEFPAHLAEIEAKLGINIGNDIASALGTDFALGVENMTPLPGWVAAAEVYKPGTLDGTIAKLVDAFNNELKADQQNKRLTLATVTQDGQVWKSLKSAASQAQVVWTYDRGYMVLSNDIGLGAKAILTRSGGFPLVRSTAFTAQLPSASGVSPSGFAWLNTKGALSSLTAMIPNQAIQKMAADRDPVLVVLNGETERIRLASRTRITSLLLDMMSTGSALGATKTMRQ
ncbi:MAG TPA: FecR domain-containing protein [Paludibaculum sp.]|jgi:hypothetical protein